MSVHYPSPYSPQYSEHEYSSEIVGDTILDGLNYYKIFENGSISHRRIDSLTGIVQQLRGTSYIYTESIISLFLSQDNTFYANSWGNSYVDHKSVVNLWGLVKPAKYYTYCGEGFLWGCSFTLIKDIGIQHLKQTGFKYKGETTLKGIILNGVVYGDTTITEVNNGSSPPESYILRQNYPNPFNPVTKIHYSVPHRSFVVIKIFYVLGNEVAELINEENSAGNYEVEFNAERLSSGVYIYRMVSGSTNLSRKMLLLK